MSYMCYVATKRFYRCPSCKSEWERFVGFVREGEYTLGLGWTDRLFVDTGPAKCQSCSRTEGPERKATKMKIIHGELAVFDEEPAEGL
jgi:hypothetical protein